MNRFFHWAITCLVLCIITQTQAQDQNLLSPLGNVGIHTLRPMSPLDVNGNARFRKDVNVEGLTLTQGLSNDGSFSLSGLDTLGGNFLLGYSNNQVFAFPVSDLEEVLYQLEEVVCDLSQVTPETPRPAPYWRASVDNTEGYLFTGHNCPAKVGIGTSVPREEFEVVGNAIIQQQLALDPSSSFNQNSKLRVNTSGHSVGLKLVQSNTQAATSTTTFIETKANDLTGKKSLTSLDILANFEPIKVFSEGEYYAHRGSGGNTRVFTGKFDNHEGISMEGSGSVLVDFKDQNSSNLDAIFEVRLADSSEPVFAIADDKISYARELVVTKPANFPDYVFASDYELRPLKELKKYIDENGKLPGLPSAVTVESQGQNLAEIQTVLVEKVEELTLYILELKREIEELKALKTKQ